MGIRIEITQPKKRRAAPGTRGEKELVPRRAPWRERDAGYLHKKPRDTAELGVNLACNIGVALSMLELRLRAQTRNRNQRRVRVLAPGRRRMEPGNKHGAQSGN